VECLAPIGGGGGVLRKMHHILVGKPGEKFTWENIIKMDFNDTGCESIDFFQLSRIGTQCCAVTNMSVKRRVSQRVKPF
jgi:hypothetical protein